MKIRNSQKGFTLVEMMVVMLVISVLLAITIPNVTKHNNSINEKGCGALKKMVQAQVQAYHLDKGTYPANLDALITDKYLDEGTKGDCPGGQKRITVNANGTVVEEVISSGQ